MAKWAALFSKFKKSNNKEKIPKDPVCGMNATTGITSEHKGQTYYFCSSHCKDQFDQDPEAYT